jgi:hypothetical protein
MIEKLIEELIQALNANTAALLKTPAPAAEVAAPTDAAVADPATITRAPKIRKGKTAPEPASEPTPEPEAQEEAPEEKEITAADLLAVAQEYLNKGGELAEIRKLNADKLGGIKKISEAAGGPHAKLAMAELKALLKSVS